MKFTRRRTRNFTVVPNELLDDSRLSHEAKAVQARLLKLPDSWQVNLRELGRWAQCGRDKMRRIVRELIETGWFEREQTRDPNTQTIGYLYIVRDEPAKGAASDKEWFPKNETITDSVGDDRLESKSPSSPDVPATEDPSTADLSPEESNIDNNKSPLTPPRGELRKSVSEISGSAGQQQMEKVKSPHGELGSSVSKAKGPQPFNTSMGLSSRLSMDSGGCVGREPIFGTSDGVN